MELPFEKMLMRTHRAMGASAISRGRCYRRGCRGPSASGGEGEGRGVALSLPSPSNQSTGQRAVRAFPARCGSDTRSISTAGALTCCVPSSVIVGTHFGLTVQTRKRCLLARVLLVGREGFAWSHLALSASDECK